jgi:hypothetical protein
LLPLLTIAVGLSISGRADAQVIWSPDYPNTWAPGAYRPQNELPFSEWYNYYSGPALYLGMTGRQGHYLEYLDRVDRAERFGRPIPPPPSYLTQPPRRLFRKRWEAPPAAIVPPVQANEAIELAPVPQPLRFKDAKE